MYIFRDKRYTKILLEKLAPVAKVHLEKLALV